MTDKELRKLSRGELLQMLITQIEETEALKGEIQTLKAKIQETETRVQEEEAKVQAAEERLKEREITLQNAGSIAEASLQLNGVFVAAQAAADEYLNNVRRMSEIQEQLSQQLRLTAEAEAAVIIDNANAYSMKARADADEYWNQVYAKAQALFSERDSLIELIQSAARKREV